MTITATTSTEADASRTRRTATCACGSLRVSVTGEPRRVYICSCLACQRATGSAFAYRASFAETAIEEVAGESAAWRRGSDSGRWLEQIFCPACGTLVYMRGEGLPGAIAISVGCFADPAFAPPAAAHRMSRKHGWYSVSDAVAIIAEP